MSAISEIKPFHEAVVDVIHQASGMEMECLATLIKTTKIPSGHDEIIAAWNERRWVLAWGDKDLGVPANLLEQKGMSSKSDGKKEGIDLNELQEEVERLLALLKDRQPGLSTWNEMVRNQLESLYKLSSQGLGK